MDAGLIVWLVCGAVLVGAGHWVIGGVMLLIALAAAQ
jgi:hypothetical protein